MSTRRKSFRTRSWFGIMNKDDDINYLKTIQYKYLCVSVLRGNGTRYVLLQFKHPRPKPGTKNTIWNKSLSIADSIELINSVGGYQFKDGQLDIWYNKADQRDWLRTSTAVEYWKEY